MSKMYLYTLELREFLLKEPVEVKIEVYLAGDGMIYAVSAPVTVS